MKHADKRTASILMAGVLTVGITAGATAVNTNGTYANEMGYAQETSVTNKATSSHQTRVNNAAPSPAPSAHHALQAWTPLSLFARSAQLTQTNALTVIHVSATGDDTNDGTEAHPYKTLQAAITNAPDGACLTIHGEQKVSSRITISKSLTLVAGDAQAKLVKEGNNGVLEFNAADKTLIVGSAQAANANAAQASSAPVLNIEKLSLKVSDGRFEMYDGVNFVGSDNSAAITLSGAQTKGAIYGGSVTTDATLAYPANAFCVSDGAQLECIKGGTFSTRSSVIKVDGENSKIGEISGGTFKNNKPTLFSNDQACIYVANGGRIKKISGGKFESTWSAALAAEDGGWVDEISGGTFNATPYVDIQRYTQNNDWWRCHYFSALLVYVSPGEKVLKHKTGIGTISGGTFNGVHSVFTVGNNDLGAEKNGEATIEKITGGTFSSTAIPNLPKTALLSTSVLFFGQVSKIDTIEGGNFTTDAGTALTLEGDFKFQETVPEIGEIKGGAFASSRGTAVLVNQGHVKKILNGTFEGTTNGYAVEVSSRRGSIDEISGGTYKGTQGVIKCEGGSIGKISNGIFYTNNDTANENFDKAAALNNHSKNALLLEPELSTTQADKGQGRYFAHLREDQWWVHTKIDQNLTMPQYTGLDGTKKDYVFSGYNYIFPFKNPSSSDAYDNAYRFFKVLFIKSDKSLGAIDRKDNDYYDASEGYDGKCHTIYALEKKYDTAGDMLDSGYRYLKKQAKLSYDANFPSGANGSGDVPQTPKEIKAFNYSYLENTVPFKNNEPAESLFEVKDNTGKLKATGYEFIGWNTKADGSGIWLKPGTYVAMPAYNVTLYAQWKSNAYTVTFKNGAEKYASVKVEKDKAIDTDSLEDQSMPQDPVKEGYTFKGWNTKEDGKGDVFSGRTVVKQNETVYAQFEKVTEEEPQVGPLYRLYNPYTHEHFFTAETVENDNLVRLGWKSEGGVGYIYKHAEKGGVYRLYNPTTGEHHYTMNEDEVATCVKAGWKNEGVKWFSAQDKDVTLNKLYSMYNPYEKKFYHHYTADAKEIAQMVKAGWRKEEVKWCTLPVSYIIKK